MFLLYILALIVGLVFVACFWPMVFAIIMIFNKHKPPQKSNHPKAK